MNGPYSSFWKRGPGYETIKTFTYLVLWLEGDPGGGGGGNSVIFIRVRADLAQTQHENTTLSKILVWKTHPV